MDESKRYYAIARARTGRVISRPGSAITCAFRWIPGTYWGVGASQDAADSMAVAYATREGRDYYCLPGIDRVNSR